MTPEKAAGITMNNYGATVLGSQTFGEAVGGIIKMLETQRLFACPSDDEQAPRPYLGQRCHIEGKGFGTIVALKLDSWNGEPYVSVARVELDCGSLPWFKVAELELLAMYSVC